MQFDSETRETKPEKSQEIGRKPRVLLAGNALGSSHLVNRLWRRGCLCEFARSFGEVLALLKGEDFYLVLCPLRLHRENFLPLIDVLEGSHASLFYVTSGQHGTWWLPALLKGRKCYRSCAVNSSEFTSVLDKVIERADNSTGVADG